MTGQSEVTGRSETTGQPAVRCGTELRRADVRAARLLGLDGAEPDDDRRTLSVTFLGRAPDELGPENIRVDGGRRITGLRALAVDIERADDPELDDRMLVTLDRAGDTSRYRLTVVEADAYGRPGTRPYPGFDPRYASTDFSFGADCPSPYDCRTEESCPPSLRPAPVIDYTARDYESMRRLVLDRMSLTTTGWTERHLPDLGVTLVELLAYTADQLSYQQDAVATEAYLDTARRRVSVRRHVRLIDYAVHDGCNARAFVALETDRRLTLPRGTFRFAAVDVSRLGPQERPQPSTVIPDEELDTLARTAAVEVFEPLGGADLVLYPAHNTIRFWTWGDQDCVLPAGATSATLRDDWHDDRYGHHPEVERHRDRPEADRHEADHPEAGRSRHRTRHLALRPGDLLVVEEVLGPRTGAAADADPAHRQAVRLTSVTPLVDELYEQPVVEVTWAPEDALSFPVCLSTHGGSDCGPIADVSVARGNVALVDHGRSLTFCGGAPETFTVPPEPVRVAPCEPDGCGCGCADRTEGSPAAEAVHGLLDRTRAGRQLGPEQVRELYALLGEPAVRRAGLGIQLAPGASAEGEDGQGAEVEPPTADAQAAALETLLDQTRYPVLPQPFRPLLRHAPVTQAAAYPDLAHVCARQAALLAGIPERVRQRLEELWHRASRGHDLSRAELAELTVLFGAQVVHALRLADRPAAGLRELLARRGRLLVAKLRRLEVLTARARAGGMLRRSGVWEVAQSWGARYASGLAADSPALAGPASGVAVQDPRAALPAVRAAVDGQEWTPRRDLLADGPRERHFVGESEDDGRLALRFGDGRHGLPPAPGALLRVAYRIGNGTAGNVGAEAINRLVVCQDEPPCPTGRGPATRPGDAVLRVRNPLPATGGVEPEPLDQVRQSAPLALSRTRLRAVTAADYAELAAALPGVRRAAAELRWTGSVQEVHVAVEPYGQATADPALLEAVGDGLEAYRRIGHDLVVRPAVLVPLDLELRICAAAGHQRGHVLAELRRVLGSRALPDGRVGFFHPDALGFGDPVRVSRLVAAAAAVPGVVSAQVTRLRRQFGRDDGELADGLLRLGALEVAACDNDPDRPENGRLSIVIGGGR